MSQENVQAFKRALDSGNRRAVRRHAVVLSRRGAKCRIARRRNQAQFRTG
jgi:hypothetical protein